MATKNMEAERQLTRDVAMRLLTHSNKEMESVHLFLSDKGRREARRRLGRVSVIWYLPFCTEKPVKVQHI